jgi:hypothetical protein
MELIALVTLKYTRRTNMVFPTIKNWSVRPTTTIGTYATWFDNEIRLLHWRPHVFATHASNVHISLTGLLWNATNSPRQLSPFRMKLAIQYDSANPQYGRVHEAGSVEIRFGWTAPHRSTQFHSTASRISGSKRGSRHARRCAVENQTDTKETGVERGIH